MKEIKVYEAFDGTRFDTESTCKRYEEKHFVPDDIEKAMITIAEFCANHYNCEGCPFNSKIDNSECYLMNRVPVYWKIRFEKS